MTKDAKDEHVLMNVVERGAQVVAFAPRCTAAGGTVFKSYVVESDVGGRQGLGFRV